MAASFKTEKWIQKLQRDLTGEERRELKQQIEADKRIRDAIVVMQGDVIVDGHNRYEIAVELGLDCPSTIINFKNPKQEVPLWIYRNQVGRRNLTPQEYKLCIGRLYNAVKAPVGKPPANSDNLTELKTAADIAEESGVSEKTVRRAAKTAELVDELSDQLKTAYSNGHVKLTEPQLTVLASMPKSDQNVAFQRVRVGGQQWDTVLPKNPKDSGKRKAEKPSRPFDEEADVMKGHIRAMQAAKKYFEDHKSKPFHELFDNNAIQADLRNAIEAVKCAMPHAVCPHCKGKGCKKKIEGKLTCDKRGWLTVEQWKATPEEHRV